MSRRRHIQHQGSASLKAYLQELAELPRGVESVELADEELDPVTVLLGARTPERVNEIEDCHARARAGR